jgi:cytochrome c2
MVRSLLVRVVAVSALSAATFGTATMPDRPLGATEPYVAGYVRFQKDDQRQRQAGVALLRELGCANCHSDDSEAVQSKPGPILTNASSRVTPTFLRRYLADPHAEKPGATMPDMLSHLTDGERTKAVEALVHYIESLGTAASQDLPPLGSKSQGKKLYHEVGCAACHGAKDGSAIQAIAIPLGSGPTLASDAALPNTPTEFAATGPVFRDKYTLSGLSSFLHNPHAVRPGGRMPDLRLTESEAQQIAAYLLDLPEVSRLTYKYYEGDWNSFPDFSKLEPKSTGPAKDIDVSPRQRNDQFGLRFESQMRVTAAGEYQFHLGSDDGSRLTLNGEVVVENGGVHPYNIKSAKVNLEPGKHIVVVDYFEAGGEEKLTVEIDGPELPRGPLTRMLTSNDPDVEPPPIETVEVDSTLVIEGRQHFQRLGCAACHQVVENGKIVPSEYRAPKLAAIIGKSQSCIGSPSGNQPRYDLSQQQKQTLESAIAVSAAQIRLHPESVIESTLATFNCYACHQRGELGGIEKEANPHFKTTIPEMGDEGRIPPHLNGIGDKVRVTYLRKILSAGADDRPYMLTRMPKFNVEPVHRLPDIFAAVDHQETAPDIDFNVSQLEVKTAGREIVGDKGFSCIKCHTFGRFRATGIQSIDMQSMATRLNEDWFRRYIANPPKYRPGTRMPSAWPLIGDSLLDHFEASSAHQISALWAYLEDGERSRLPSGLETPPMELVPIDEAIIYRNFIEGSGPRAIAVGYPEGVHQAFDANQLRLAMLWNGRFIDASRHWAGRGQGFQPPAGDKVLTFADGPAWAELPTADAAWPTQSAKALGQRFLGYRLTPDQRPTFRYRVAKAIISDTLEVQGLGAGDPIPRRFTVQNEGNPIWFRVASGNLVPAKDGWWRVDDRWNVLVSDNSGQTINLQEKTGGILGLEIPPGEFEFRVHYQW